MHKIAKIVRWTNGMVMVFDQFGQQIVEYQGLWDEVKDKILADKPTGVPIIGPQEWPMVRDFN